MSGPWEQYREQPSGGDGPWKNYAAEPAPVDAKPLTKLDKVKRGLWDPLDGAAQLLENSLPKGVVRAGVDANNWLADKTGLVSRVPQGGVDQQVRERQADYEVRRKAGGETGVDWLRTGGSIIPSLLVTAATGGAGAGLGMAGRVGAGAAQGAAWSAAAPVAGNGDYWDEKKKQLATGAAVGAALPPALGALSRIVSPNASKNAQLALLKSEGVRPTIGQGLGGFANKVEEKLTSVPLAGDMIARARQGANSTFEAAAINRSLKPIGDKLPAGVTGREAIEYAEQKLGAKYDDVLTKIGAITPDQQFTTKVNSLTRMVQNSRIPDSEKAKFYMSLDKVNMAMGQNGVIPSSVFKTLESDLGSTVRKLSGSQNVYDGEIAPAVKQVQQELREMLRRQAGAHAFDLANANKGWANFKRVQRAASSVGAENGNFTPAQLQNSVKALDRSKDKGAFARGSALGQDLSDAGKAILGSKVPDSGTAGRVGWGMGGAAALFEPSLLAGAVGGAGLYLSPVQRLLLGAASSRPAAAEPAAQALRKASPMLIPGFTQLSLNGGME